MAHSKKTIDEVWEKGAKIRGKNPALYRKDSCGNTLFKPSYGKTSLMSWHIDHIIPKSKGGKNEINNYQPLHSRTNLSKGKKLNNYC